MALGGKTFNSHFGDDDLVITESYIFPLSIFASSLLKVMLHELLALPVCTEHIIVKVNTDL